MNWQDILKIKTEDAIRDAKRFAPDVIDDDRKETVQKLYDEVLAFFKKENFKLSKISTGRDNYTQEYFIAPKKEYKKLLDGVDFYRSEFFEELEMGIFEEDLIVARIPSGMHLSRFGVREKDNPKPLEIKTEYIRNMMDASRVATEYIKNWEIAYKEFKDRGGFNQ